MQSVGRIAPGGLRRLTMRGAWRFSLDKRDRHKAPALARRGFFLQPAKGIRKANPAVFQYARQLKKTFWLNVSATLPAPLFAFPCRAGPHPARAHGPPRFTPRKMAILFVLFCQNCGQSWNTVPPGHKPGKPPRCASVQVPGKHRSPPPGGTPLQRRLASGERRALMWRQQTVPHRARSA